MNQRLADFARARPVAVSVLLAVAFLPLKLFGSELSYLNIHAARDWERGWQMLHGVRAWWHGPELLFGGSIPGCFFNLLAGLFQIPHRNPFFAATGPPLLFCASIGFLHDALRRLFGHRVALGTALCYGAFPLGTLALRYLWNPSYLFLFLVVAWWCLARAIAEGRRGFIAGGLLSLLLAAQIHLSVWAAVVGFVAVAAVYRLRPGWKPLLAALAIEALTLAPYYVDQAAHGWPDRAAQELASLDPKTTLGRIKPNPNFWSPFAMQLVVQDPSMPQVAPFSYYERFYTLSSSNRAIGRAGFVLSLGGLAAMLLGLATAFRRAGGEPARIARTRFARAAIAVGAIVCLPHWLWNPKLGSGGNVHVPVRYFFAMWPTQFILLAAGLSWLLSLSRLRRLAGVAVSILLASSVAVSSALVVKFHLDARESGLPFRYLFYDHWPVHALRDKMAVAEFLAGKYGLDEALFLSHVHTQDDLLQTPEESLDYEMRAAIESLAPERAPDPELYFFIFNPADGARIRGEIRRVEVRRFGSLAVLVYRPLVSLKDWQPDPPVSWWWY